VRAAEFSDNQGLIQALSTSMPPERGSMGEADQPIQSNYLITGPLTISAVLKGPVVGELLKSRGDRRLIESATVLLPPV